MFVKYLMLGIIIIIGIVTMYVGYNNRALQESDSELYKKHPTLVRCLYICGGFIVVVLSILAVVDVIHIS